MTCRRRKEACKEERARSEREKRKSVKVGYSKLNIDGKLYVWNEDTREVREKKNF